VGYLRRRESESERERESWQYSRAACVSVEQSWKVTTKWGNEREEKKKMSSDSWSSGTPSALAIHPLLLPTDRNINSLLLGF